MIIIGITGTNGAGKGTVVEYLVNKKGFKHFSVSGYLKEKLQRKNLPINRDEMIKIANEIREKFGPDYITQKLFNEAKADNQNSVIESIRNSKEAMFIKSHRGFLIAIDANQKTRYERISSRGSEKDLVTLSKFKDQEKKEMTTSNPNEQNLKRCIEISDFVIDNDGTIKKLHEEIEKILNKIKS